MLLNRPGAGGAGQAMPDGRAPVPGGWNRVQIEVDDLAATVQNLKGAGRKFQNEIVIGNGGKQILRDDPSGNPIELFEPAPQLTQAHHVGLIGHHPLQSLDLVLEPVDSGGLVVRSGRLGHAVAEPGNSSDDDRHHPTHTTAFFQPMSEPPWRPGHAAGLASTAARRDAI
jgi:hypothetical protein